MVGGWLLLLVVGGWVLVVGGWVLVVGGVSGWWRWWLVLVVEWFLFLVGG